MLHTYSVYGMPVQVDRPLVGLTPAGEDPVRPVSIRFGDASGWAADALSGPRKIRFQSGDGLGGRPASVRVWTYPESGAFHFAYPDGVEFVIDRSGRNVSVRGEDSGSDDGAASYLVGVILGFALRLAGRVALHASVVAVDGRAVALLGDAGSGKSTLAAAFAAAGHEILSDDVCVPAAHADGFLAEPGYAGIRLWPDSVQALFGSPDALPRITRGWDKRYLDLSTSGYRFVASRRPVRALYWLGGARRAGGAATIEPLSRPQLMMKLVCASYPAHLLDTTMRSQEFDVLARMAACIPGRRVESRDDLRSLPETCQAIASDVRGLDVLH